ncbi:MAG: gliding motility-associated ABC transporter ATP-binding subunit GldA [Crocinitomicaceae bacterium]|nr:gliding motility-associated ABC transporter ATP-binding subunit GldA [Crocinitomicaceae bacterium]
MSIEVSNLFKYYGEQAALLDVSFSVPSGQITGFLGPNGAGKSTTMKIITGYISSSNGLVNVCGQEVDTENLDIRKKIGYLPENNPLYTDLYVKEYLLFVAGMYKLKNKKERVKEVISLVGLELEQHKKIESLSKGYRQRVGIAQAIIHDPEVLILDEPTSGLDPNQLDSVRKLIKSIGKEKTVLLSTHIMQEVEAICDRIIILNKGQIVADRLSKDLQASNKKQVIFLQFNKTTTRSQMLKIKGVDSVSYHNDGWLLESDKEIEIRKNINEFASNNGLVIDALQLKKKTMEQFFKELTKN